MAVVTAPRRDRSRVAASAPVGLVLVLVYLAAACVVGALPSLTGISPESIVDATAFSPADLVAGRLWLLPLSGFVVDGDTWLQLAALAEVALLLTVVADARTFWRAAIGAHVGSTLVAYALIAVLLDFAPDSVQGLISAPDYGVSCVWAGAVGALAVVAARRCSSPATAVAAFAAISAPVAVLLSGGFVSGGNVDLAGVEHALAFALGILAGFLHRPAPRRAPVLRPA